MLPFESRLLDGYAALPDGTFLITNGAKQGVAGFGLASDPNFQALLYDPTQPVGSRISILGTTIVARLYHSESTVRAFTFIVTEVYLDCHVSSFSLMAVY